MELRTAEEAQKRWRTAAATGTVRRRAPAS